MKESQKLTVESHAPPARPRTADGVRIGTAVLQTQILPLTAMEGLAEQWQALVEAMAEPNVFAEPWMLAPAFQWLSDPDHTIELLTVWRDGLLVGVMPIETRSKLGRLPLRTVGDWAHANMFLSGIAIRAGYEGKFWAHALRHLATRAQHPRMLSLSAIVEGSAVHHGLCAAAQAHYLPIAHERETTRAFCANPAGAEAYWDATVRAKKRKELRRQWNRLGEEGTLGVTRLPDDADVEPWITAFLALEQSGWKGRAGSALASAADTQGFFRAALTAAHQRGQACLTAITLNERPIAMLATLTAHQGGFAFKTAFDEAYGRFSPGVLLQRESLKILGHERLDWIDSCAAQDHPMIDHLWAERRRVLHVSLPLPGGANRLLSSSARMVRALWHSAKGLRQQPPKADMTEVSSND